MRILLFSDYYHPDGGSAAPLFTMLSEELVQRGHMVTVITTVPHYPSGKVPAAYKGWSIRKTVENGVCIIRLPLPSVDRKNLPIYYLPDSVSHIQSSVGF
jgi:colanic acid biosynthesis glycosyl transferase WcaI